VQHRKRIIYTSRLPSDGLAGSYSGDPERNHCSRSLVWCLFRLEIGAIYAEQLKELQKRDRRSHQYWCGSHACRWKDGRILEGPGWVSHQSHADQCTSVSSPRSNQLNL